MVILTLMGIASVPFPSVINPYNFNRIKFADSIFQQSKLDIVSILITSLQEQSEDVRVGAMLSLAHGSTYFDRQSTQAASPILKRIFHNSKIYSLWRKENQKLVTTAFKARKEGRTNEALSQVKKIVFSDRLGLAAFAALIWLEPQFGDDLKYENIYSSF